MLWMFNYCSFSQVYPLCVVAEDYGTARCLHGHNMAIQYRTEHISVYTLYLT